MTRASETWLVLGASSAIARAFAIQAARGGADVLLAGRDLADLEASAADIRIRTGRNAAMLSFDAVDFTSHPAFIDRVRGMAGDTTLNLFLAFGIMPAQAEIDAEPALGPAVIAANFTGAVSVLQAVAPVFEAQRRGRIVVLSSVAGDRGRLKNYVYGATKAGLTTYLQGLRARLFRVGVSVTTVKPGLVDTAMTWGLPGMFLVAEPGRVAKACLRAAARGRDEIYVPLFWWGIMTIIRNIPERIAKRLSI
jgi:short-subunit dehydrogenase